MTRIIFVLVGGWMVGCAPCSVSPPQTFQGEPILVGSDPDAVFDAIDLPDLPTVGLWSTKGKTSLAVFQANTGQPYLNLGDTDVEIEGENRPSSEVLAEIGRRPF